MTENTSYLFLEKLEELGDLLARVRTIALVGLSPNPDRDSHSVGAYLQSSGYRVIGVNPGASEVLSEPCYASLTAIPEEVRRQIDLVTIFRKPSAVAPILEEAAGLGLRAVWLQIGVSSPVAIETASLLGLTLVANKCIRVVHGIVRVKMRQLWAP